MNRRRFFSRLGFAAAVPAVGAAKAFGMVEKPQRIAPIKRGDLMSSSDLNRRFQELHDRIDRET